MEIYALGLTDAKLPVPEEILSEIQQKFGKPYNKYGISDDEALPFLAALNEASLNVPQNINDALDCFKYLINKFIP